jgi:hypothetical protein
MKVVHLSLFPLVPGTSGGAPEVIASLTVQ